MTRTLIQPTKQKLPASEHKFAPTAAPSDKSSLCISDDALAELVSLFKLVADETRLRILYYLTQRKELHVRALCELLDQSQPAVSHHLASLRMAGLIDRRRQGKHNFYGLRASRLTGLLDAFFARLPEKARAEHDGNFELSRTGSPGREGASRITRVAGADDGLIK